MKFKWARYGGYEVSSKGDKRFSAFNAIMPDGRSIEVIYQNDIKGICPGGTDWRIGKGKPALRNVSRAVLYEEYKSLWRYWLKTNPRLFEELRNHAIAGGYLLSDRFANSDINQARALSDILNENERVN